MSAFNNARRAPNVSQYLHGLNTIPPPAPQQDIPSDIAHIGDDLDFLANADFFDFDSFNPGNVDHHNASYAAAHAEHKRSGAAVNAPNYQFSEFQTYPPTVGSSPASATALHGFPNQPHHSLTYPGAAQPQPGEKRKASVANSLPSAADLEDSSRMAAEEDKRRRNTAASARFRIKKKQREAALEKQTKEMSDKVSQLEGKVQQLEMENKWLKGLITEKSDGKEVALKESDERIAGDDAKGVGTKEVVAVEEDVEEEDE